MYHLTKILKLWRKN